MADVYRQSAFSIELKTEGEIRWFTNIFEMCSRVSTGSHFEDQKVLAYLEDYGILKGDLEECGWGWGFLFDKPRLYIGGDNEFPNIDLMATVLTAYLLEHDDHRAISFTYADTCSKPRPDHFGGGVVVCTREGAEFAHTDTIMTKMVNEAVSARKASPAEIQHTCPQCQGSHQLQYVSRVYEYHNILTLRSDGAVEFESLDDSSNDDDFRDHFYCPQCGDTFDLHKATSTFEKQT